MNVAAWAKGLLAAVIGAGANAITLLVVDPQHFNFSAAGFAPLWHAAAISGLLAGAGYLKQSPLPQSPVQK